MMVVDFVALVCLIGVRIGEKLPIVQWNIKDFILFSVKMILAQLNFSIFNLLNVILEYSVRISKLKSKE